MNRRESATKTLPSFGGFLIAIILSFVAVGSWAQTLVTPAEYLASLPKPNFATNHHLPHLTRWGWQLSSNALVELARNWDYTLDLGEANQFLSNHVYHLPTSMEAGLINLASNDPAHFVLSCEIARGLITPVPVDVYTTNAAGLFVAQNQSAFMNITNGTPVISPEGPDTYWQSMADDQASWIACVNAVWPIKIVLNGGEYGLEVDGFGRAAWSIDPRVQAATNYPGFTWPDYSTKSKARQLGFLTAAIYQTFTNRELYIFYNTTIESYKNAYVTGWDDWGWHSDIMNTNTDLPSFESYFVGSWTNAPVAPYGYTPDLLTKYLNSVGYNISIGYKTNYSWVCGGWGTNAAKLSDIPRYMGFLKCLYTGGMVGAVAGYFDYPTGGFNVSFPADNPPHWLLQIVALSRVHAFFSRLDDLLENSDLLGGPNLHAMSRAYPAYEIPTGDPGLRVLTRKKRGANEWLITAWAAAGADRSVTVTITNLGTVSLLARASGAVYDATATNQIRLLDIDGLLLDQPPLPPTKLQVLPGAAN